jgi:hypothetical protein
MSASEQEWVHAVQMSRARFRSEYHRDRVIARRLRCAPAFHRNARTQRRFRYADIGAMNEPADSTCRTADRAADRCRRDGCGERCVAGAVHGNRHRDEPFRDDTGPRPVTDPA